MTPRVALTIAASDSGGGAGIQADLKTFAALGVFGTCAITGVTAQNTVEVRDLLPVDASFVVHQIEAVLDDLHVAAVKTGLLVTAPTVAAVARLAAAERLANLVVDPVMVASTGRPLLDANAQQAYVERLVPHAVVLTPNAREAGVLLGRSVCTHAERRDAAAALGALGARCVVVTGGDALDDADESVDIVWGVPGLSELRSARVPTLNTHGSGCSFASAVAAQLALGAGVGDALVTAKSFVHDAVAAGASWHLGAGHGPLHHFYRDRHWETPQ